MLDRIDRVGAGIPLVCARRGGRSIGAVALAMAVAIAVQAQ